MLAPLHVHAVVLLGAALGAGGGGGIESFDCTSTDEMKQGESLRAWRSGGPDGATWNWYGSDLLCTVVVHAGCDGGGNVVLKLGRRATAKGTIALSQRDPTSLALRVPAARWERALKHGKKSIYDTLEVSVRVDGKCTAGTPPDRHWSDHFAGGFAGGE